MEASQVLGSVRAEPLVETSNEVRYEADIQRALIEVSLHQAGPTVQTTSYHGHADQHCHISMSS
jgi:hypothetical protein